jgi:hypothetical protein
MYCGKQHASTKLSIKRRLNGRCLDNYNRNKTIINMISIGDNVGTPTSISLGNLINVQTNNFTDHESLATTPTKNSWPHTLVQTIINYL